MINCTYEDVQVPTNILCSYSKPDGAVWLDDEGQFLLYTATFGVNIDSDIGFGKVIDTFSSWVKLQNMDVPESKGK